MKPIANASLTNTSWALPRPRLVFSRDDVSGSEPRPAERSRILLVEDDYLIALQVETALIDSGFEITGVAASADEALDLATARRPTLAVMDIRLSGRRDGIDAALELFRQLGIRCIFATAHSDPEVVQRAQPARPLAWLQKPYTMASLVQAIRSALTELEEPRQ